MNCFIFLEDGIDIHGPVAFQNAAGMTVAGFLELVAFFLNSTFSTGNGGTYLQKNGICFRSCIAPILSDFYLARKDRVLADRLKTAMSADNFKFVDDCLVVFPCDEQSTNTLM